MKKVSKKRIAILIVLMILIIFEIIAFQFSKAKDAKEINVEIQDYSKAVATENGKLKAENGGKSGYYITIPEIITDKYIIKYYVEEKQIESETSTSEHAKNITNNVATNMQEQSAIINTNNKQATTPATTSKTIEKNPGEKIYLTNDELKSSKISLKVEYDKKDANNQSLYNRKIETQIDKKNKDKKVTIDGYMPIDATVKVEEVKAEDIKEQTKDYTSENINVKVAYDIKIISNGNEYEPQDFDENVAVNITGIEDSKSKYRVLHIDENKTEEIEKVEYKKDEGITFEATKFSVYAVLLDETQIVSSDADISVMAEESTDEQVVYTSSIAELSLNADTWDGSIATKFEYGNGTNTEPYLITGADELAYLAEQVNNGTTYEGKYFQLIVDIDLDGKTWTPIGNNTNSFRGIFDGCGHIISNAKIVVPSTMTAYTYNTYGLFGTIGGGSSYSIIKNIEIDNFNVDFQSTSTLRYGGIYVGIVTGKMYRYSEIVNVIVKNSNISDSTTPQVYGNTMQLFVGGIAGFVANTSSSESDPGNGSRYAIENCYSAVDFDLDITLRNNSMSNAGQYAVGGIVGAVRTQPVWPENCLYSGTINATNAFTAPIIAYLRSSTSYTSYKNFPTIWDGNNAGNLTMTSYYTNYSTNNKTFTTTVQSGLAGTSSAYRVNTSSSNIGYVQGINKGIYTNDVASRLNSFNSYDTTGEYTNWIFENGTYKFLPRLGIDIDDSNEPTYTMNITNNYNTNPTYTYKWLVDGELRSDLTGNSITQEMSFDKGYDIEVLINDGAYYTLAKLKIPQLEIHIEFDINEKTNTVTAVLAGTALKYIQQSDYTYKWYVTDLSGMETEEIADATNKTLTGIEKGNDYKVVATNNNRNSLSTKNMFTYGDRIAVYVDYNKGDNNNDGLTPETPVKTMPIAYTRLSATAGRETNVIVIMGDYSNNDFIHNMSTSNETNFSKNATLTGCYKGIDYSARLYFVGNPDDNNGKGGRILYADTTFQYLTFYASTSSSGTGRTNIYCQGHSLTIGEQVKRDRYSMTQNTNALVDGASAPDFHILGGFPNLNTQSLVANNGTILIKSGCFARVIAGSRNTVVNSTAKNTTGSDTNPFNMKIIVDVKNSTKGNVKYDVNLLVSGQTDGNIYGNMDINIKNGTIGKVTGGSIGYSRTISNYPSNSYFGSTKLTVEGGSIDEMFGGSLGRLQSDVYYYGKIDIYIKGGTINNTLYGVGAGGVTGYSTSSTDPYKSYGKGYETSVNITISGGTIDGNIYGGGYGYSSYLTNTQIATDGGTLYGDSTITITGGTITGNIYGAGRGYSGYSGRTKLAQMNGNSTINISGTPEISGNIYGAGEGVSGYADNAKLIGTSNININTDLGINVYGGGNIAQTEGTTNVNINLGNQTKEIYGGGNVGLVKGDTNIYIKGGTANYIYGGGKSANVTTSNVFLQGGTVSNIFGGSNTSGTVDSSNIITTSGTATTIYGGNNAGGTTTVSNVHIQGANITGDIYGGGNEASTGTTNVYLTNSENVLNYVYGGGKSADASKTNINLDGATVTNTFGGSNTSGTVTRSNVNVNKGTLENIYGGNNAGGITTTSNVCINDGTITNAFGGGNKAVTITSHVTTKGGKTTNIYGGGNEAGVTTSNVHLLGGNVENTFGGANQSGDVENTNIINAPMVDTDAGTGNGTGSGSGTGTGTGTETGNTDSSIKMEVTYSAQDATSWQNSSFKSLVTIDVKLTNTTSETIDTWDGYVYVENSALNTNYSQTNLTEENGKYSFNQDNRYYGINSLSAGGSYSFQFTAYTTTESSNVTIDYGLNGKSLTIPDVVEPTTPEEPEEPETPDENDDTLVLNVGDIFGGNNQGGTTKNSNIQITKGTIINIYGGNNAGGETTTSNVIINGGTITNVYGGNNAGGETTISNVTIKGGTITDVYGGGDKATTNETNVQINSEIEHSVYGGGNQAGVNTNTNVNLNGATIKDNIYGGGNEGTVTQNTYVHIYNSKLNNSVYAGGNGATAIVYGNTNLIMDGTTNEVLKSVFGGGNKAETGSQVKNDSSSTVNIVNGKIGGNVYGAANTSVVYGTANVKIGYNAVNDTGLTNGNVQINGTVFGGGEANEAGSEVYDFSFISVTKGINIDINAHGHDTFTIKGSIFGSGNASSTSGESYINLKEYGTIDNPESNISIQRATRVTLDNSAIALSGATDRTNEYSSTYFTLSRVDEMKLKNNSTVYLNCGANLLKKFTSVVDQNGQEVKAVAIVNDETGETTRNVDNRIYMAEGKNLNIATNEQVTAYGEVYGMTFFGLFTNTMNPATSTGLYNHNYNNTDEITNVGTFSSNSYVLGQHKTDHDTQIDGFYSNYDEEGKIKTKYIGTTPEDDVYFIWLVGEELDVTTFEIGLTASKYATLGTYELGLTGFATPNLKFSLIGFSAGLANGVTLVNPNDIQNVETDEEKANSIYGLAMRSGNNGWQTNSSTTFLTANGGTYTGTSTYNSDNSSYTPALNFCFYHSENITRKQDLGTVKIRFQVLTPIDDLTYGISYIDVNVTLSSALYQNDFYEAAITPGEEFGLFTTTETNITDESVFSTYYSLYIDKFSESDYYAGYKNDKHILVSRNSSNLPYVFPVNTKITMIDLVTNKYYYYVVTDSDVSNNKYVYPLTNFVEMGSENVYFNETNASNTYYNKDQDLIYENFIYHIDFGENNIPSDITNNTLLMELRDSEEQTLIGVLGIQRDTMLYSVYKDKGAKIKVTAETNTDTIYLGSLFNLNVTSNFTQNITSSKTIYDTKYFDEKMGIKISIIDNNGNQLNSDTLLGVNFTLDNQIYYPRIDGSVRIHTADKVSNVLSKIKVNTKNNTTIATGDYTIRVESFGSPDGIYYGTTSSDTAEVKVTIINSNYGLKVYSSDKSKIVDAKTGNTLGGSNSLSTIVEYSSGLENPNIRMALYRRKYDDIYSQNYEKVDLADYVTNTLKASKKDQEYYFEETNPVASLTAFLYLKPELITGTYKLVFKLYDNESVIGEAYEYIIIK